MLKCCNTIIWSYIKQIYPLKGILCAFLHLGCVKSLHPGALFWNTWHPVLSKGKVKKSKDASNLHILWAFITNRMCLSPEDPFKLYYGYFDICYVGCGVFSTELQLFLAMARNFSNATVCKIDQKGAKMCLNVHINVSKRDDFGSSIRTCQESQCLPDAGFFGLLPWDISLNSDKPSSCRQGLINFCPRVLWEKRLTYLLTHLINHEAFCRAAHGFARVC